SGRKREDRKVRQMFRQGRDQLLGLVFGQYANAPWCFGQHPHRGRLVEPFPFAHTLPQDRPYQSQVPVDRRVAAALRQLRLSDLVDQLSIDSIELPAAKIGIEPSKLRLIVVVRRLVLLFLNPPYRCFIPTSARPFTQFPQPPSFRLQLVVVLLRFGLAFSPSSSAYSLSVRSVEIDPPGTAVMFA